MVHFFISLWRTVRSYLTSKETHGFFTPGFYLYLSLVAAYLVIRGSTAPQVIHTLVWVALLGTFGLFAYDTSERFLGENLTS